MLMSRPGRLADEDGRGQHRHAHPPERAVVDVHDLDAALLRSLAPCTSFSILWPRGGSSSTVTRNSPASTLRWSSVGAAVVSEGRRPRSPRAGRAAARRRAAARARRVAVHRLAHGPDVVGVRPAAAAHHARARRDHPRRVVGHVRRRRDVDEPLADPARQPGIRLDGDGQASHLGQHVLEHVEERARADRAVGADHLHGQIPERPRHLGRRVAEKGHEVLGEARPG